MDKIGAVNLNMHPEDVKDFSVFSKDYGHSIENMESSHELRYKDYDKILRQNDNFRLVIDTTHALYSGQLNGLFNRFRKKIVYSHLSMNYHEHLHLPLNIFSKERLNALNIIKKDKFPVVIESQTGDIEAKEYKKEVNFVRKWLNS
jgi:sugar phosphate isomerase/epimerase